MAKHHRSLQLQTGHIEDVVVDKKYRGQKLGQRYDNPVEWSCSPDIRTMYTGSSKRSSHMLKARAAIKSSLTVLTATWPSMKSVVSRRKRSKWSDSMHWHVQASVAVCYQGLTVLCVAICAGPIHACREGVKHVIIDVNTAALCCKQLCSMLC